MRLDHNSFKLRKWTSACALRGFGETKKKLPFAGYFPAVARFASYGGQAAFAARVIMRADFGGQAGVKELRVLFTG